MSLRTNASGVEDSSYKTDCVLRIDQKRLVGGVARMVCLDNKALCFLRLASVLVVAAGTPCALRCLVLCAQRCPLRNRFEFERLRPTQL